MTDDPAKWVKAMSECLTAMVREQNFSRYPVVDHELIASPTGNPDDMCVWCIFRSDEDKLLFDCTEYSHYVSALRQKMITVGFPESAIASLTTRLTSREEVSARGGRYFFFN